MNKVSLFLIAVSLIALSVPARVVLAQGTTVEVNNGIAITLNLGGSIAATTSSGLPVTVKGLPALGAPANGLAGFRFDFSWNQGVLRVDSAFKNNAAGWDAILPGTPDNINGKLTSTGFTTKYTTDNITLLYLGVTAVGSAGSSTSIDVTITSFGDKDGIRVPAAPVNVPVKISAAKLVSLAVTPAASSIQSASSQQFTAMGTYDDASVVNVTGLAAWTTGNGAIATIQSSGQVNPGLASSLTSGTTTITAAVGTVSAAATLIVTKVNEKPASSPPGQTTVTPPLPSTPPPQVSQPGTAPSTGEINLPGVPSTTQSGTSTPTGGTQTINTLQTTQSGTTPTAGDTKTVSAPGAPAAPPPTSAGTTRWGIFGGIGAGVVILGAALYFLLRKRIFV